MFLYTMLGVAAAGVIFGVTRAFARGPPSTLNKEWQEATNEYVKVSIASRACTALPMARDSRTGETRLHRHSSSLQYTDTFMTYRRRRLNPSLSPVTRTTRALDTCKARRNQRSKPYRLDQFENRRRCCIFGLCRAFIAISAPMGGVSAVQEPFPCVDYCRTGCKTGESRKRLVSYTLPAAAFATV